MPSARVSNQGPFMDVPGKNGDPFERDYQTDDVLSPHVVAFVNEVMSTWTSRDDAWSLRNALRGKNLNRLDGHTLNTLYDASIYTELPIPEGHDHPEVREFVQQCQPAIDAFERYHGSSQHRVDDEVDYRVMWAQRFQGVRGVVLHPDERERATEVVSRFDLTTDGERVSGRDLAVQARAQIEDETYARIRERLGVSAGQEDFPDTTPTVTDPDEHVRKIALTCKKTRQQKRTAEHHRHKNSRDYAYAPPHTIELVDWICDQQERIWTKDIPVLLDPYGHRLAWLRTRKFLIHVCQDGEILLVPDWNDPRWNPDYDPSERFLRWGGRETDTWNYPTWTKGESAHPKAGLTWGPLAKQEVKAYVIEQARLGHHHGSKQVAAYLNQNRRPEGYRFLSVDAVRKILKELHESGELAQIKKADRWRENHGWVNVPAHYCHPDEVLQGKKPIAPVMTFADLATQIKARRRDLVEQGRKAA